MGTSRPSHQGYVAIVGCPVINPLYAKVEETWCHGKAKCAFHKVNPSLHDQQIGQKTITEGGFGCSCWMICATAISYAGPVLYLLPGLKLMMRQGECVPAGPVGPLSLLTPLTMVSFCIGWTRLGFGHCFAVIQLLFDWYILEWC